MDFSESLCYSQLLSEPLRELLDVQRYFRRCCCPLLCLTKGPGAGSPRQAAARTGKDSSLVVGRRLETPPRHTWEPRGDFLWAGIILHKPIEHKNQQSPLLLSRSVAWHLVCLQMPMSLGWVEKPRTGQQRLWHRGWQHPDRRAGTATSAAGQRHSRATSKAWGRNHSFVPSCSSSLSSLSAGPGPRRDCQSSAMATLLLYMASKPIQGTGR